MYDPVRVFFYNYWLYVCSGFWKYEPSNRWKAVFYKWYRISIILFYASSMTLFTVDAVQVSHDLAKLSFNMSSSVLVFMKVMEFAMLSRLRENVIQMCDNLDNHFYLDTVGRSQDDKDIFRRKAQITLRITITFYLLLAIGLPLRVVADTALATRAYIIPIPFVDLLRPYYPYLYAQQVFGSFHFMATTLAFDLLQFTLLLRFIAHYEILEKNIFKIKSLKICWRGGLLGEQERVFRLLKQNIIHHQKLLAEIKNFCVTYNRPLLVQVCGMLLLVGILILQLIFLSSDLLSPIFIQQIIYAVSASLNIFYLSSLGSQLATKSASVADAFYDTPWYDTTTTNRKLVQLTLQRLGIGPKLKGGSMVVIERPLCLKFLQFSYNMTTLLRQKV